MEFQPQKLVIYSGCLTYLDVTPVPPMAPSYPGFSAPRDGQLRRLVAHAAAAAGLEDAGRVVQDLVLGSGTILEINQQNNQ